MNEWMNECRILDSTALCGRNVSHSSLLRRKLRQACAAAESRVEVTQATERFLYRHLWSAALGIHTSYHQYKCCDIISTSIPALADVSTVHTTHKNDKQGHAIAEVVCRPSLSAVAWIQSQSGPVWYVMDKVTMGQVSGYRRPPVSAVGRSPKKKIGKLKKPFRSLKARARRERAEILWNPAAQTHPVLDSSSFFPVPTLPRKLATILLLAFSLFQLVAALSQCLCSESNKKNGEVGEYPQ